VDSQEEVADKVPGPARVDRVALTREFVDRLALKHIYFESFSAKLRRLAKPSGAQFQVKTASSRLPEALLFRYDAECQLWRAGSSAGISDNRGTVAGDEAAAGEREVLGDVNVVVVCEFQLSEGIDLSDEGSWRSSVQTLATGWRSLIFARR
jgi:hypothetical protein